MPWLDGLGFSLQLITLGLGGFLVIKGYMTLGNLVSFNSFLWMIDGPVRQSGWLINDWQRFNASCIKIRKLLTEQPRIVEKPDAVEAVKQAVTIVEQVKHDDEATAERPWLPEHPVPSSPPNASPARCTSRATSASTMSASPSPTTRRPRSSRPRLHMPAGSKLGILGETGAGKSTLVSLISRFYDPTVGHVLIDGIDARDWPLATCARRCASWRRIRSCSPTPSAATSASVPAVNSDEPIYRRKWPRSPARTASSAACRKVMTPWWANAAWACPAGRSSACRWPARSRTIRRS
jgi:ABC-type multidrug transport system fused ATPase/permease subunit